MAEIGEIKKGLEIGRINKADKYHKFIWQACSKCGKERWVAIRNDKPVRILCSICANKNKVLSEETIEKYRQAGSKKKGSHWTEDSKTKIRGTNNYHWKGGRYKTVKGYIEIAVYPNDFFYPMAFHGRIKEHRLVVAKRLGRCLLPWEIVHHINGIKDDNRDENLQLTQEMQHNQITIMENKITKLETKVEDQAKQIRLLQWQIKELNTERVKEHLSD